jgi:hypothetical protein
MIWGNEAILRSLPVGIAYILIIIAHISMDVREAIGVLSIKTQAFMDTRQHKKHLLTVNSQTLKKETE